jgi:hypothetical protein
VLLPVLRPVLLLRLVLPLGLPPVLLVLPLRRRTLVLQQTPRQLLLHPVLSLRQVLASWA